MRPLRGLNASAILSNKMHVKNISGGGSSHIVVLAGVLFFAISLLTFAQPQKAFATYGLDSPSILCAPNTCSVDKMSNSFQDVRLVKIDTNSNGVKDTWTVQDYLSGVDAKDQVIEIADQSNHFMKEVTIGVYVTKDVYDAMSTKPLTLSFEKRSCNKADKPEWNVEVIGKDGTDVAMTYDNDASRSTFCNDPDPVELNLSSYLSRFSAFGGDDSLYHADIHIVMKNFTGTSTRDEKNVRFRLRLANLCASVTCREYLSQVKIDDKGTRNFALSVLGPSQDKVTRSEPEAENDPDTYDYFTEDYKQRLIRKYVEFGLECSQKTAQKRTVYLYDINDGDNVGKEYHGWVGGKDYVGAMIQYYDVTTSQWKQVSKGDITLQKATIYDLTTERSIALDNYRLYRLNNSSLVKGSYIVRPTNGDRITTTIEFEMKPDTRYRLAITPDSPVNFMAVGMPSDSIYGIIECQAKPAPRGERPYFEVAGGDVLAGIAYGGSSDPANVVAWNRDNDPVGNYNGGNAQLAVIATGSITSFRSSVNFGAPSRLSFGNETASVSADYGGGFEAMPNGPSASVIVGDTPCGSLNLGSLTKSTYNCTGDVTVSGTLPVGKNATIRSTGSVFIGGNTLYSPYDMTNVPRLNIYATNDIVVFGPASEMHGVFVAGGNFYSCGTSGGARYTYLPADIANSNTSCPGALTVYGSVTAQKFYLTRSNGSYDGTDGTNPVAVTPAERFIYSPEVWLAKPNGVNKTFDSYTSLPPIL